MTSYNTKNLTNKYFKITHFTNNELEINVKHISLE